MTILNPSSCLKVKRDTFYVPDENGGVYFRNNVSSFRMEGRTIFQWIEKLVPMFNGEQTLAELTKGLTVPYQNRVYELAETLVKNGFIRDISKDQPHQLPKTILNQYASQIEFIESFTESGAFRFQQYREAKVLTIGSGTSIVSLVSSLLQSGLPQFTVMITDSATTNWERVRELEQKARKKDVMVEISTVPFQQGIGTNSIGDRIQNYDWILYVSEDGNIEEIKAMNKLCKEENKAFIPVICLEHVGLAGPLCGLGEEACFDSAWRRLHREALKKENEAVNISTAAKSILVNVAVFELFKRVSGIKNPNQSQQIYYLNLLTLEGEWLNFIAHPFEAKKEVSVRLTEDLEGLLKQKQRKNEPPPNLLNYFSSLTSEEIGIFHTWEERNLSQLPLAQCYVQAVDPLSEGPAELLSEVVSAGFTHQEAQKEAGLTGIEMYVSRWMDSPKKDGIEIDDGILGIGAGETVEEAVCRGLQTCLEEMLQKRMVEIKSVSYRLKIGRIEDRSCRFYFHALTTLNGVPSIGMEEDLFGFPVIWVRSKGRHYTKVGLNTTLALRNALKQALLDAQNQVRKGEQQPATGAVFLKLNDSKLEIPSCDDITQLELLRSSLQVLKQTSRRMILYDLAVEPFLKQELAGVFGVQLREERP